MYTCAERCNSREQQVLCSVPRN